MLVLGSKEKPMSRSLLRAAGENKSDCGFVWSAILTPTVALASAVVLPLLLANPAYGADVTWGGNYRIEGVKIRGPEMTSEASDKAYLLHHLVLTPKIVAADGLTIYSRLDILNDPNFGISSTGQVTSVAGDVLGAGPNPSASSGQTTGPATNSWGRTQRASMIGVTALYASWAQEFGQLVVGRTPVQFGLGTYYSAGNSLFDHYIDTKDMVGYKMVLGNLFILPMMGKVHEGNLGQEDDVDDYMIHVQYDNPESELSLGFFYDIRVAAGNDAPTSVMGGTGSTLTGSFKNTMMGLYFSEKAGSHFRVSAEADMLSGDTGVQTSTGQGVGLNAFGIAGELAWNPGADSKWSGVFKLGMATGDDPGTNDTYEGFQFNRNYDVGMLLFNHPLGQRDFMRTALLRNTSNTGAGKASNQIDSEAISNTIYFAPTLQYRSRENLSYGTTFVYAMLNKDPIKDPTAGSAQSVNYGTAMNLGYELDFSVTYKPFDRMTWITEFGGLLPGDAWKAGSQNLETKMVFGLITKAAINF